MDRFCIICGKLLVGKQRKLCSDKECHRERQRQRSYKYYQNNRDKDNERSREYYQNNREKMDEYYREWRQNNRENKREYNNVYYWKNIEKIKKCNREWSQNNQEKRLEYERRRYRRNLGLPEDADLHEESSLERIMREWLQENNIEFEAQYYINLEGANYTKVDFYIPEGNICLYCDGNYYHLLPNAKKCDENQNRILPQMGYNVIRLTETEILEGNRPKLI